MRTKNFVLTLCVVVSMSLIFIIFGQQKPESIQNIVTTTNEQIRNFKVVVHSVYFNFFIYLKRKCLQDNLRDAETKTLNADEEFLTVLDFTNNPRLFPKDIWRNTSLPVVVTYVFDGQESQAIGLILSVSKVLPNNTILVYNMGLSDSSLKMVSHYCIYVYFMTINWFYLESLFDSYLNF